MYHQLNILDKRNTEIILRDGTKVKANNRPEGWYISTWRDGKPTWDGEILIDGLSIGDVCCWLNERIG